MSNLKRYGVNASIESAAGFQQFEVYATDEEDALRKFQNGEGTGEIIFSEVEVQGLATHSLTVEDVEEIPEEDHTPATDSQKQYAERDVEELDARGDYYFRHVFAMTGEQLHSKSGIAAELGHRDMMYDRLTRIVEERDQKLTELADGLREALEMASQIDQYDLLHLERKQQVARLESLIDEDLY